MSEIWIRAVFAVDAEDADAFGAVATEMVSLARERDPRTTSYHVFLDAPASRATFLEHYPDSEAFLEHRAAQDDPLRARLYALGNVDTFEIYGQPTDSLLELLGRNGPVPVSWLVAGFSVPEG